jgi:hypothetical protein
MEKIHGIARAEENVLGLLHAIHVVNMRHCLREVSCTALNGSAFSLFAAQ